MIIVKKSSFIEKGGLNENLNTQLAFKDLLLKLIDKNKIEVPENLGSLSIASISSQINKDNLKITELLIDSYISSYRNQAKLSLIQNLRANKINHFNHFNEDILYYSKIAADPKHNILLNIQSDTINQLSSYCGDSIIIDKSRGTLKNLKTPFLFLLPQIFTKNSNYIGFRVRAHCLSPSFVRIFYLPTKFDDFTINNTITKLTYEGNSESFFVLESKDLSENFLIEFGTDSDIFSIREIKVISA